MKAEIDTVNKKLKQSPNLINRFTKEFLDFGEVAKNIFSVNLFTKVLDKAEDTADELLKISDVMGGCSEDHKDDPW